MSAPVVPLVPLAHRADEAAGEAELVVLLGPDRERVGTAPKVAVHTDSTPLHLAFSCYVVDAAGRLLVTRRALGKATWPGVWTNSVCGHPGPGEAIEDAVVRRARTELGLGLREVALVLPDFAYRAVDASGVVENEVCPVYVAVADGDPAPAADEVAEWQWAAWDDVLDLAARCPWALSPWAVEQLEQLRPSVRDGRVVAGRPSAVGDYAADVLECVAAIPPGRVLTYGDVAELIGWGAARSVGAAMSRHGGAVPWWRVVRADGTLPATLARQAAGHWAAEGVPQLPDVDPPAVDVARARWEGPRGQD